MLIFSSLTRYQLIINFDPRLYCFNDHHMYAGSFMPRVLFAIFSLSEMRNLWQQHAFFIPYIFGVFKNKLQNGLKPPESVSKTYKVY